MLRASAVAAATVAGSLSLITATAPASPALLPSSTLQTLDAGTIGSASAQPVAIGAVVYFSADDGDRGTELYKSVSGGPAALVKDIDPGPAGSSPTGLVADGSTLYFGADDGTHGPQLWKSDGTEAGTTMVGSFAAGGVTPLAIMDGVLYLSLDDGVHGAELWRSDGTLTGTALVKDINAGGGSSLPGVPNLGGESGMEAAASDPLVYFPADDGTDGRELWVSDGTAGGTTLTKDQAAGPDDTNVSELHPTAHGVVYQAVGEPYGSDGTTSGTGIIKDIDATPGYTSSPSDFVDFDGETYFTAQVHDVGAAVWKTDGTEAGTVKVTADFPGGVRGLALVDDTLYFGADNGGTAGFELWQTDGTVGGTSLAANVNPGPGTSQPQQLTAFDHALYFQAFDGTHGAELWRFDGTTATELADIAPGAADGFPERLTASADGVWFTADDGVHGEQPWFTDGTSGGTTALTLPTPGSLKISESASAGGVLVYRDSEGHSNAPARLFATDGTTGGSRELTTGPDDAVGLVAFGGKVYFQGSSSADGNELWVSDGTDGGTHEVGDFAPGGQDGVTEVPVVAAGKLLYEGGDGNNYNQLVGSDGTAGGTAVISDPSTLQYVQYLTSLGAKAIFMGRDPNGDEQVYVTDGTTVGTHLVPGLPAGGGPDSEGFGVLDGKAYFSYYNEDGDYGLYETDGTTTSLVTAYGGGFEGAPVASGGKLYWAGYDNDNNGVAGYQVFVTDGTAAGTHVVKDLGSNPDGSDAPSEITSLGNGKVAFLAGRTPGLWVTDGTDAGTLKVTDAVAAGDPALRQVGHHVWFAGVEAGGTELWRTDGTVAGTGPAADLVPGAGSSHPAAIGDLGGKVLAVGSVAGAGSRLYRVDAPVDTDDATPSDDTTPAATVTVTPPAAPAAPVAPVANPVPGKPAGRPAPVRVTLKVAAGKHRRAPYRYAIRGAVVVPKGVAKSAACKGTVTITARRGGHVIARATAKLTKSCTYSVTVTKTTNKLLAAHGGTLTLEAQFAGNAALRPRRSPAARVVYGRH